MENTNTFKPVELNERNVKAIFKKCLADENNISQGVYYARVLNEETSGKESDLIRFSKGMVKAYTPSIRYLLGQIKAFHRSTETFALEEGFLRYDDVFWTKDYDVLFKLYALGLSSASITNFAPLENLLVSAKNPECTPTLSTRDPNYAAWWEEHKGEWE